MCKLQGDGDVGLDECYRCGNQDYSAAADEWMGHVLRMDENSSELENYGEGIMEKDCGGGKE